MKLHKYNLHVNVQVLCLELNTLFTLLSATIFVSHKILVIFDIIGLLRENNISCLFCSVSKEKKRTLIVGGTIQAISYEDVLRKISKAFSGFVLGIYIKYSYRSFPFLFFMPPPFEEWWRGIKCYPCPCVRASIRPLSKFVVRSITFKIWYFDI